MDRRVWGWVLALFSLVISVLETYAVRSRRSASPELDQLDDEGLSEKAAFPTLSAYIWSLAGIYPKAPRSKWTVPLLGVLMGWFTLHILFMVPWPFEREVIDRVRNQRARWSQRL